MAIKNRKSSSQERNQRKALLDLAAARLVKKACLKLKFCFHITEHIKNAFNLDNQAMRLCRVKTMKIRRTFVTMKESFHFLSQSYTYVNPVTIKIHIFYLNNRY